LRSCIRLTLGGEPYSLNGYEQYDMNFNLLSLVDLTFKLVDFRPFNLNGSSNQFGETPIAPVNLNYRQMFIQIL
jgi:hypothetical protein